MIGYAEIPTPKVKTLQLVITTLKSLSAKTISNHNYSLNTGYFFIVILVIDRYISQYYITTLA